jgi:signal peptidase II
LIDADLWRRWLAFFAIAAMVIVADQISKFWIDANFAVASTHPAAGGTEPTPVIGEFVRIAKTYNTGGIFGLIGDSAAVLALASTVVIALIVVYQWREGLRGPWLLTLALGLLLGGAVGNFIDRVRRGAVIDFVDMGIGDLRWYTFNVADAAISISLLLLILLAVLPQLMPRLRGAEQP